MKKKRSQLKILLDTNAIYTGSASDLLRIEITELINRHKKLSDLDIVWYLPDIVIRERKFQMNKKGIELLPNIVKLERLLGHNLNITENIISSRIDENISRQLEQYSIQVVNLDLKKIEWKNIINSAINRSPPFEDNEKEKGFRDALILESLKQIIADSPKTKSACRIVFVSNDNRVVIAATTQTQQNSNVSIFNKPDELVSLINTLNSEISEELVNSILPDANKLFFQEGDETTLYYTEQLRSQITDKFFEKINEKPEGVDIRKNIKWRINKPGFEKKVKQRIYFKSLIEVEFETYRKLPRPAYTQFYEYPRSFYTGLGNEDPFRTGIIYPTSVKPTVLRTFSGQDVWLGDQETSTEKLNNGKSRFEILWSVTITTNKRLKSPKVEEINFVDILY